MIKPEKRERQITQEYWFCGVEGSGHYHLTEKSALTCAERKTAVKQDNRAERNARLSKALELRRSGKTYKEVGVVLGVCPGRAGQIIGQAERLERRMSAQKEKIEQVKEFDLKGLDISSVPMSILMDELSVRSANCMKNARLDKGTIGDLLAIPEAVLLKTQNFRRKSLWEIRDAIEEIKVKIAKSGGSL